MLLKETVVAVNGLVILESLPPEERQTGSLLYEDLLHHSDRLGFRLAYYRVETKREFLHQMAAVAQEARRGGLRPIVHLEIHGEKGQGLVLASGERVAWDELADLSRAIIETTDNNLVMVMATCHGYEAIKGIVTFREVTPFTFLLGPDQEVKSGDIEQAFGEYYRTLFERADFESATEFLPANYDRFNCEKAFALAFAHHILTDGTNSRRQARTEAIVSKARQLAGPNLDLKAYRRHAKEAIKPSPKWFNDFRRQFLLTDRPANRGRFTLAFADVEKIVNDYKRARRS